MTQIIFIASSFAIGFFFESVFGFGGGIIAYSILSFFVEIKTAIIAGFYVGTLSSLYIVISSYQHFEKKIFSKLMLISIIGSIIGVACFIYLPVKILSLIFGFLLIFIALKNLFFEKKTDSNIELELQKKKLNFLKIKLIFIGGIAQGAFGTGGPFVVNALKYDFANKSSLRTTMASYFLFCNILRLPFLFYKDEFSMDFFKEIWWIIIPVFIAIFLGHKVHLKIKPQYFRIGIGLITLIAGIKFLFY